MPTLTMTPRSQANSGVPEAAMMSVPWWRCSNPVPVIRGARNESTKLCGSPTGKTKPATEMALPASCIATRRRARSTSPRSRSASTLAASRAPVAVRDRRRVSLVTRLSTRPLASW